MPEFDVTEVHSIRIKASPEAVYHSLLGVYSSLERINPASLVERDKKTRRAKACRG
jgi:hypothetical protein